MNLIDKLSLAIGRVVLWGLAGAAAFGSGLLAVFGYGWILIQCGVSFDFAGIIICLTALAIVLGIINYPSGKWVMYQKDK